MGVIGNHARNNFGCHNNASGNVFARTPGNRLKPSNWLNTLRRDRNTTVLNEALPSGSTPASGTSYFAPPEGGGMCMRATGSGVFSGNLIPSRAMSIDLTGLGSFDATAALVISAVIAMTGNGDFDATINGRLNASIDMTGSGDLDATVSGIGHMIASLGGSGELAAAITAIASMEMDIVVTGTGLTTANVADAVWAKIIDSGFSADQILQMVAAVSLGKSSGFVAGSSSTPVFKNLDGTITIVTGSVDANGNRTSVTLTPES